VEATKQKGNINKVLRSDTGGFVINYYVSLRWHPRSLFFVHPEYGTGKQYARTGTLYTRRFVGTTERMSLKQTSNSSSIMLTGR
jgi:hypothetical protein